MNRFKWSGRVLVVLFHAVVLNAVAVVLAWGGSSEASLFVADELLIQPRAGVPKANIEAVLNALGATEVQELPQLGIKRIKIAPQALENVRGALSHHPHFKYAEKNFLARSASIPNDSGYANQWNLPKISAPQGWDISTGSSTVDIAIIDSGVDPSHPDLANKIIPGYNFLAANTDTHDVLGHGTAVAGVAAALGNNALGVAGLAWNNPIMPLVVLDATDYASYSNIANAIVYAVDHGVRIINISIGGSSSSTTLQSAVDYAWSKGAVVFACAMNNSTSTPYYPAACNHVVAVSATASGDNLASFSNYGTWITVAAPGAYIYTTNNGGGYGYWNGTSFSSPLTAGLGALILSVNPFLTNQQVVALITQNTDDLGAAGFDQYFGYGRINAYKTLVAAGTAVPQADTVAPVVAITSPGTGASVAGVTAVNVSATDSVGVTKVDLYRNGILFATDISQPFSFSWDTTTTADGTYNLVAYAYDAAGNVAQSGQVALNVRNHPETIAPTVS